MSGDYRITADLTLQKYLSASPPNLRTTLLHILGMPDQPLEWSVGSLLRDPSPSDETIKSIELAYKELAHMKLPWLAGALGFFLFVRSAETRLDASETANQYLEDASVREFIIAEYRLPTTLPTTWTLHRVGTTSYLLRTSNGRALALKLIKPKYFDRRDIASDTAAYMKVFAKYQGTSPVVHGCGRRFIVMDFVEGQTLGSYMTTTLLRIEGSGRLTITRNIVSKLCSILHDFHANEIRHLDVSPDNIILTDTANLTDDHPPTDFIKLIDFGPNHILREGVGTATDFEEIRSYVAPEVIADYHAGTYLSDAYSLGRIFLQLLVGDDRRGEFSHVLDRAWAEYPQLASLIEELVDESPDNRLLNGPRGRSALAFVNKRISLELELQEKIQKEATKVGFLGIIIGLTPEVTNPLKEMLETAKALETHGDKERIDDLARLARFCRATAVAFGAVLTCFSFVAFVGFDKWLMWRERLLGMRAGNRLDYLPGLLVGLSFTMLASRYYLNIFARVSTKACWGYAPLSHLSKRADYLMRVNSVAFAFFTIGGMLLDARWWPIYCALGVVGSAVNDFSALALSKGARSAIENTLRLPASNEYQHFLDVFSSWGYLMLLYAGVLFMVSAVLIKFHEAKDQWIFAGAVIVLNTVMLKRHCTKLAPVVRGGILRLVEGLARVARKMDGPVIT